MHNIFLDNKYKNIQGITIIDSGKKGPNIGILAITHGNEKVGLSTFDNLLNDINISQNILKGKVYLIAVNILAYQKFVKEKDVDKYRFIDHNMNRIHGKPFDSNSYEFQRKKELEPVFDELDIVVDLHSVPKGEDTICITDIKNKELSKKLFDVETILLDDISNSGALIGYLTSQGKIGFGLECGNHIFEFGYKNAIKNILNLLGYYGIISKNYIVRQKKYKQMVYKFIKEIYPKTKDFRYTKDFKNFNKLSIDEVYGKDGNEVYKNTYNKNIYIGFIKKKIISNDGCGFLFEKID